MTLEHATTQRSRVARLMDILCTPWVDKTIAIVATVPFIIDLYQRWLGGNFYFIRAALGINVLIVIVTMMGRTAPSRVTPNPWFWLLAFVATYGKFMAVIFAERGTPLVGRPIGIGLIIMSLLVYVYARLSLGRSIGFVPAQRVIVTRGAYQFVRHPIYTGAFISILAFVLVAFSPLNLAMGCAFAMLYMVKSIIEERFLQDDPEYAEYLRRVRWRWVPGVA